MQTRRIKRIISYRDWPRLKRREQWNRAMALLANHNPKPRRGRSHALVFSLLKNAKGLVGVWVHPVGRGFEFIDILGQLSGDLPSASVGVVFRQLTIYLCLSSVSGRSQGDTHQGEPAPIKGCYARRLCNLRSLPNASLIRPAASTSHGFFAPAPVHDIADRPGHCAEQGRRVRGSIASTIGEAG
jgi:hypothetical protein